MFLNCVKSCYLHVQYFPYHDKMARVKMSTAEARDGILELVFACLQGVSCGSLSGVV